MKIKAMVDIVRLALSKKRLSQKACYILQGIIFAPFIIYAERKSKKIGQDVTESNQAGDDVYPLF